MKHNKWTLFFIGLGMLQPALAHAKHASSGFYLGGQGGFIAGNGIARTEYNKGVHVETDHNPLGGRSLLGGLFLGGGGYIGKVYLGLRGGWAYQSLYTTYRQTSSNLTNMFYSVRHRETWDVAGLLGFSPAHDVLLYLKIASVWGRWSAFSSNELIASATASRALFRPGIAGGLGVEMAFCPSRRPKKGGKWIWGGEFTYVSYSSFQLVNASTVGGATSITPRTAALTVHIKYAF